VVKAADLIAELLTLPKSTAWYFGIDAGECAFTWSALSGYSAFGRPMVRARILANLAPRYKTRALITNTAREGIEIPVKRLDALKTPNGSEVFYQLGSKNDKVPD
jgi:hypothetical protein